MIYFTFSPMLRLLAFIQPLIAYSCHSHDDAFRHHSLVIEVKVVSPPSQPLILLNQKAELATTRCYLQLRLII